jgi:hypothetical protein
MVLWLSVLFLVIGTVHVYADPVTLGNLSVDAQQQGGTLSFSGSRFTFAGGAGFGNIGNYVPITQCSFGQCQQGQSFDAGVTLTTPYDLSGTFMLDGRSYSFDASSERILMNLTLMATVMTPAQLELGLFTVTAPFLMTGNFLWFNTFGNDPANPTLSFSGQGLLTAMMEYVSTPDGNQMYFRGANYNFTAAHAPEPGTWLMIVSGLLLGLHLRKVAHA